MRTAGIYTIMITLAIATAFFYFVRQNYALFNGFNGFHGVEPPTLLRPLLRDPVPFYYLSLAVAAFFYAAVVYAARSTFGLTPAGHPRQSAAHAGARLQRAGPSRVRLLSRRA